MTLQNVAGAMAEWQFISTGLAALAQRDQDIEAERRELQRMLEEREQEQQAVRLKAAYMAGQWEQYTASKIAAGVGQPWAAARTHALLGNASGPTTPGDHPLALPGYHNVVSCTSRDVLLPQSWLLRYELVSRRHKRGCGSSSTATWRRSRAPAHARG